MLRAFAMSDFSSSSTGNITLLFSIPLPYFCASDTTPQLFFKKLASLFSLFPKVLCYLDSQSTRNRIFFIAYKGQKCACRYEANKTAQVLFPSFIEATVPKLLKWPFVIKSGIDCKAQFGKCSRLNRTGESLWKLLSWRQMFKSWIFTIPQKIMVYFCCCFVSHFSPSSWSGILLSSSLL